MSEAVEIKTLQDAIHVEKENQTVVDYYLFNEYEIHLNTIPPHSIQEWHYHSQIEETLVVIDGTIIASWLEQNEVKQAVINPNELIRVKQSIHTFSNNTDNEARFIVFRFVPDGSNKQELIKQDKKVIEKEKIDEICNLL